MINIELFGQEISSKEEIHKIFNEALCLPDYYGCNLDALYDVLSTYSEYVEISVYDEEDLCQNVPFYGERIMGMLRVAAQENDRIIIKMGGIDPEDDDMW